MSATPWTPIDSAGRMNAAFLLLPGRSAPGCLFEVRAFDGRLGESDGAMAALFGVMATFPAVRFRVVVGRWDIFHAWVDWAHRRVNGIHKAPLGQLLLHHLQRVSEADTFRVGTDAIVRRPWPLANVTLATALLRTQVEVTATVPKLLTAPAARREVLLDPNEPIDLTSESFLTTWCVSCDWTSSANSLPVFVAGTHTCPSCGEAVFPQVDAVRVRGGSEPLQVSVLRGLRDQVVAALGPDGFSIDGADGTQGTLDGVDWSEGR